MEAQVGAQVGAQGAPEAPEVKVNCCIGFKNIFSLEVFLAGLVNCNLIFQFSYIIKRFYLHGMYCHGTLFGKKADFS